MYRVGVIGLGSIAEGYGQPDDPNSYCHVAGILHGRSVELAAVADLQEERRQGFREKWGGVLGSFADYASHQDLLEENPDIVAVCVRGPQHSAVMMDVIAAGPRAIFLEKPPTCSLAEMDEMVAAARAKSIPITVSYSRHWAPHVLRLQKLVQEGLIGDVQTVVGYTGHSFLSFASHVTDLICQFAGYCPRAVFARGRVSGEAPEGYEPEPALDAMIVEFAGRIADDPHGIAGFQVGVNGEHGGFYCDVFGTKGLVRAGIYIPAHARDGEGKTLDLSEHGMPENAADAERPSVFTVAYDQIAGYLDGGPLPACTNQDFIAVHEIGFAGIESVLTNRRVELPNTNRTRKVFANG